MDYSSVEKIAAVYKVAGLPFNPHRIVMPRPPNVGRLRYALGPVNEEALGGHLSDWLARNVGSRVGAATSRYEQPVQMAKSTLLKKVGLRQPGAKSVVEEAVHLSPEEIRAMRPKK